MIRDILKLGGTLTLITIIAATGLAAVYSITHPLILEQKRLAIERALTTALPMADREAIVPIEKDGQVLFYKGYADKERTQLVGYAFVARGPGYSSVIETMVGVDTTGKIVGMKVLAQTETPGLGTRVEEIRYGESTPWFTDQFIGRPADRLAVDKDGGEIQSITGATISSRALTKSVVAGYKQLMQYLQETEGVTESNMRS